MATLLDSKMLKFENSTIASFDPRSYNSYHPVFVRENR